MTFIMIAVWVAGLLTGYILAHNRLYMSRWKEGFDKGYEIAKKNFICK